MHPDVGGCGCVQLDGRATDAEPPGRVRHGRGRIRGEVHDDLVDLRRIRENRGQIRVDLRVDLDRGGNRGAQQPERILDRRLQRHRRARVLLTPAERENLRDQVLGPGARFRDLHETLLDARLACELRAQQLRVSEDRGQDVVEVVRNAARQRADRLHLLRLPQLLLQPFSMRFGALPSGNVANRGDHLVGRASHDAGLVVARRNVDRENVFEGCDAAGIERPLDRLLQRVAHVLRNRQRQEARSDDPLRREERVPVRSREIEERPVAVDTEDHVGDRIEQRALPRVRPSQGVVGITQLDRPLDDAGLELLGESTDLGFDALAVGDVLGKADDAVNRAGLVAQRESAVTDPALLAVGPNDSILLVVVSLRLLGQRRMDHAVAVFRVDGRQPIAGVDVQLGARPAPDLLVRRADVDHLVLVRRRDPEDLVDRFRDLPESLFALPARGLHPLARADVSQDDLDRGALGVRVQRRGHLDVDDLSIEPYVAPLLEHRRALSVESLLHALRHREVLVRMDEIEGGTSDDLRASPEPRRRAAAGLAKITRLDWTIKTASGESSTRRR
jgi:hypothetical protein